jgi:hypothetical protein
VTKIEVAKSIIKDGDCNKTDGHPYILCSECPAGPKAIKCLAGKGFGKNSHFAKWFRDWLKKSEVKV